MNALLEKEGALYQLTLVIDRIQSLKRCLTEGLSFSLVVGWRPPSVSCHMSLCNKSQQTEKAIAD
jgi:hypothetical protein